MKCLQVVQDIRHAGDGGLAAGGQASLGLVTSREQDTISAHGIRHMEIRKAGLLSYLRSGGTLEDIVNLCADALSQAGFFGSAAM